MNSEQTFLSAFGNFWAYAFNGCGWESGKRSNTFDEFSDKHMYSHPAFTCSELTVETLNQGVKYVQS